MCPVGIQLAPIQAGPPPLSIVLTGSHSIIPMGGEVATCERASDGAPELIVSAKLKLLYVTNPATGLADLPAGLRESAEVVGRPQPLAGPGHAGPRAVRRDLCHGRTFSGGAAAAAAARKRPHSGRHARRGGPARHRLHHPVGQPPVAPLVQPGQHRRRAVLRGAGQSRCRRLRRLSAAQGPAERPAQQLAAQDGRRPALSDARRADHRSDRTTRGTWW